MVVDKGDAYATALENGMVRWVAETAIDVERYSKEVTPVDTGNLRRSIHISFVSTLEAHIGTDVEYAGFVHDGTRYVAARPFMLWGVQAAESAAAARLDAVMRAAGNV